MGEARASSGPRYRPSRSNLFQSPIIKMSSLGAVALAGLGTLLLPWAATGTTNRSAFALAQALTAAGMLNGMWDRGLHDTLVAMPVLVAVVIVACIFGQSRVATVLIVLEFLVLFVASLVAIEELGGQADAGPWLATTLGALAAIAAVVAAQRKRSSLVNNS